MDEPQEGSYFVESPICRPKVQHIEGAGRQKVHVDIADASSCK